MTQWPTTFQSTRPARGATSKDDVPRLIRHVSIHAPRTGRDTMAYHDRRLSRRFNPRAPHGARPACSQTTATSPCFNPRAPHGARLGPVHDKDFWGPVSIHAPRTGRDVGKGVQIRRCDMFQSTRPARGATSVSTYWTFARVFQSTRPARGATTQRD